MCIVLASAAVLAGAGGCVATRGWVHEQMTPLESRVGATEEGLRGTQADLARLAAAMQNLRLERSLVLDLREGATFGFGSANLTGGAKAEIDRFLNEIEERDRQAGSAATRLFVVAGHTDSAGSEDLNYELGQQRASKVAAYLVAHKGVDPLAVSAVSYGESKPLVDNSTVRGRQQNRRVEILVYSERISATP
jgi:outer membrane protein OmpA-like peptidoglycan-associated protein